MWYLSFHKRETGETLVFLPHNLWNTSIVAQELEGALHMASILV